MTAEFKNNPAVTFIYNVCRYSTGQTDLHKRMTELSRESYADLERKLAACAAELARERAYRQAIGDVLRVISSSPTDLQPVFDVIAERAMTLCDAQVANTVRFDGELLHLMSISGVADKKVIDNIRAAYPMALDGPGLHVTAVLTGAPAQIPDVLADPQYPEGFRNAAERMGVRSVLAVPLVRDGEVLGSIAVARAEPSVFSDELVSLLETFADQAVIAIKNVGLFGATQEALERQTATAEILRVISRSPTEVQPVFEAIAERAMVMCSALGAVTTRYDGELVHAMASAGGPGVVDGLMDGILAAFPMKLGQAGVSARAVLEGVPVQIADVFADPEYADTLKGAFESVGARSTLAVPMLRDGEVAGTITVLRAEPGLFPEELVNLLETFADQAVIAIENVRLFNETKEALEQQTAISEILRVISESPTDVQPVFDAIAERAMALTGSAIGVTTRFDGEIMHLTSASGLSAEVVDAARALFPMKPDRNSASGRTIIDRAPVQITDALAEPDYFFPTGAQESRSLLAVPLMREDRVVGSIVVGRNTTGSFPDKLVDLLETFADQAVIAIENVRLFKETQEALEQQTAISEILRVISESPTDVQPVFDAIAERAMALCNAETSAASCFIWRPSRASRRRSSKQPAPRSRRSPGPI